MSQGDDAIPSVVDDIATQPVSRRGQILIVDDHPSNLMALEVALAPLDRPIVRANSGREALLHILERDFTVVLLDVQMPGMDGFETATLIRARARTKHLPIIFLTAHDHDHDMVLRAYRLGAVDFLHKPIEPVVLLAKTSVFVSLRDRTEDLATERLQRELEVARRDYETHALRRQMEALAEADRRKDSFLAILGHELRNPLAPIRTAIDLVKDRPDQPLPARTIEIIDRQTKMLTRLVEDLLDLSRINADKIELRPERADLRAIVEAAVATSRPSVEARNHQLSVDLGAAPVHVVVDHVRLVQVITNLINNAARYTERGGEIGVACGAVRDRGFVRVSDNGIGIPTELMPRIFDMFVQERARSAGSGGLGLGLALARRLVEMHHGTITASSEGRSRGSTFEIELPLDGAEGDPLRAALTHSVDG